MAKRLSYSAALLVLSAAPAFAGGMGGESGVGAVIVQAVKSLADKLVGMLF